MSFKIITTLCALMLLPAAAGAQIYVKADAVGANNGSSWTHAYTDLQDALAAATSGDEIWVAAGTYKPTAGTDEQIRFGMVDGVSVYGGFAGGETLLSQRDIAANLTILSGEIGAPGPADNSNHVVHASSLSGGRLDGFTITAGDGGLGAGVWNQSSTFDYENLHIVGNHALTFGGGMYVTGFANMTNLVFESNSAASGGGLYTAANASDCTFIGNTATTLGGGVYSAADNAFYDCTFRENGASDQGGGIYADGPLTVERCTFIGNSGTNGGGGIGSYAAIHVTDVVFEANHTPNGVGGAVRLTGPVTSWFVNTVFFENVADNSDGGAISCVGSNLLLTNVTCYGNSARAGGVIHNNQAGGTYTNVIMWGNTASAFDDEVYNLLTTPAISHSIVGGCGGSGGGWDTGLGTDGGGNVDADPLFVDPANGILRLATGSAAIEAGDNGAPHLTATDIDGNPRIIGTNVDAGAYESTVPVAVGDLPPGAAAIESVYPNPFNPNVTITYRLARRQSVRIAIYDVSGARVRTLVDESRPAGVGRATWDGRTDGGTYAASGVYFVRLEFGGGYNLRKVTLIK